MEITKPINVQGLISAIEANKPIIIPTNITDASQVGGNAVTMAKMENDGFIYLNVIVPYLDGVHKEYFIQIKITTAQLIKSGSNGSITLKELVAKTDLKTINGESILGSGDITISGGGGVYITPFTVEQFCTGWIELTDEQRNELLNAASQNRIIGMPYGGDNQIGYIVADCDYRLNEYDDNFWGLYLGVIYDGAYYSNSITSNVNLNFSKSRATITPFKPLIYIVTVEDGVAEVIDDDFYTDNCIFMVEGECTELYIYLDPSMIGKTVRFFTGESCTLEIGYSAYWANGEVPTIEPFTNYELSLVVNTEGVFNAVLTPFKSV